jgi:hypothetical protein
MPQRASDGVRTRDRPSQQKICAIKRLKARRTHAAQAAEFGRSSPARDKRDNRRDTRNFDLRQEISVSRFPSAPPKVRAVQTRAGRLAEGRSVQKRRTRS